MKAGRRDDAVQNFRYATALRPRDPKIHFALGVVLAATGDCVLARQEFSAALSLDPKLTRAQEQMDKCGAVAKPASSSAGADRPVGASRTSQGSPPPLVPVKGP